MGRKRVVVMVLVVLVAAFWVGNRFREATAYMRDLEQFRVLEFRNWVSHQIAAAYSLDRAVAEVLVAADGCRRHLP
ncbi:MAG: hypothetical protein AB1445_03380 [Bacillota bacterium]